MARVQFSEDTKPEASDPTPSPRASTKTTGKRLVRDRAATIFGAQHLLVLLLFVWFLLLHLSGIYLFTKGFLLTRLVLNSKSDCAAPPISLPGVEEKETTCWYPEKFSKAVVVIIDALRYDFTVPQAQGDIYHNVFSVLYETAATTPQNALLLPFIADPPTATLQRLKGLTTGTLPVFMDIGSNFAGTAIDEDNLLSQALALNKTLVHLGDDTWHQLFPDFFHPNLTHPFDSFNVWDLHTVDNGVTEYIMPHMKRSSEWDLLIGHYLGVDHAGHRYGPNHPQMTLKLRQMDELIRELMSNLPDDTLLVVMGDHGMDSKGDHGGESDDEVEAALWMYSKQPFFGRTSPEHVKPPATAKIRPVAQIDLVPTLALLLGLPIPFNNLGAPIPEAFIGPDGKDWEQLAKADLLAAAQIRRYQADYAIARGIPEEAESRPSDLWTSLMQALETGKESSNERDPARLKPVAEAASRYMTANLQLCKSMWASFDIPCMLMGVAVLALALAAFLGYARSSGSDIGSIPPMLVGAFSGGVIGGVLGRVAVAAGLDVSQFDATVFGAAFTSILGALGLWLEYVGTSWPFPNTLWGWLGLLVTVAQAAGFAANSFTIWEDEILLFFIGTFGLMALLSSFRQRDQKERVLGAYHSALFLVLARLASMSRLCRDEQMPHCRTTYYASATSSTAANWHLAVPYTVAALLPTIIRGYYENTGSYHGSAALWIGFALRLGLLVSAVYWTLNAADDGGWLEMDSSTLGTIKVVVAQAVLAVGFIGGTVTFIWAPPPLKIDGVDRSSSSDATGAGRPTIQVSGYSNLHGARYALLPLSLLLPFVLVQKPLGAGTMALMAWQIFSLLEIIDANKLRDSAIGPVMLSLLGSFYFFKTGHQATLASIQWDSAFVALRTLRYPWAPILVVLNTWAAQILATAAVPLIVLWRQPAKRSGLLASVGRALATHLCYYATINLATAMWAGHLRRHLMLYRVFSPRFMLGAAVMLLVDVIAILGALLGFRTNMMAVTGIFGWS